MLNMIEEEQESKISMIKSKLIMSISLEYIIRV